MKKILFIVTALLLILVGVAESQVPFSPETGKTVTISASTTSADEAVASLGAEVLLITNSGAVTVFVKCGAGAQEAAATDTPVPPLTSVIMARGSYMDTCAAITASSTATVYVTPGWGGVYSALQMSGTQKYSGATSLVANTSDGADSSNICIAGGGACEAIRGARYEAFGNEHSVTPGRINLMTGAATSGQVNMKLRGDDNRFVVFDASSDTSHTLTFGDGGTTANQSLNITASTPDGDDDGSMCFSGGGACSADRGAYVRAYGEDSGTNPGLLELRSGIAAGHNVEVATGGLFSINPRYDPSRRFRFDANSDIAHTLTFGDGGTTATQNLSIMATTPDGDDDSTISICSGGACGSSRGARLHLEASDYGGANAGGGIYLVPGVGSNDDLIIRDADYSADYKSKFVYTTVTPSGATTDTSNFIPAGSVVKGCTARVVTAITGATSWSLGLTTDTDRYGTAIAIALNTTTSSTNWVPATGGEGVEWHTNAATALRLTAAGSNFTGGSVRIVCMTETMTGPIS